jgi:hypothetical protein
MYKTIAVLCLTGALAWAQDPVKVAGGQYRLIAENEDVGFWRWTWSRRQKR